MILSSFKNKFIETNFFRPRAYSIFFNPYFISRSGIYKNIKKFSEMIGNGKKILDVGCGIKPYEKIFRDNHYLGIDIADGGHNKADKKVDKFFNGINIPYEDESFDVIICTEVLEHSEEPLMLLKECNRVLLSDGLIFISMPFVYPEHETPFDFQRFTQYGLKRELHLANFSILEIKHTTGIFGTMGQLLSLFIFESITFRNSLLKLLLSVFFLAPLQIFSLLLDKIFGNNKLTLNYIVIAKKK